MVGWWLPGRFLLFLFCQFDLSMKRISMDGKGRWVDNVFVERPWRSLKYEEIYLKAYDSVALARASIGRYLAFFNTERRHQSLGRRTPDQVYYESVDQRKAAYLEGHLSGCPTYGVHFWLRNCTRRSVS